MALAPSLILQPLIENAVKYGVSRAAHPVTVRIHAEQAESTLRLSVEDDGSDPPAFQPGSGVGLLNVRERLAARFGADALCESGPSREGGFRDLITVPLLRDQGGL